MTPPGVRQRSGSAVLAARNSGIPLGRIGGIRISLSFSWLISAALIVILATPVVQQSIPGTSTAAAAFVAGCLAVLLGASVLVHELGHCLAARSLGLPVLQVRLYLLGGVSELGRTPASPREEAVVAAAGPGLSALLAGLFFLLVGSVRDHSVGWLLLIELALANAVVAVFNLFPALPLDGGRVLRAGVWQLTGRRRWGTAAAAIGGYLVAIALVIWAAVQFTGSTRAAFLQGAIAAVMGVFVAVGAAAEHRTERQVLWPSDLSLASLARPVVQLPIEVPVALALQAAGGRAVILTGADGVAAGLLDEAAAITLSRTNPRAPAVGVTRPIQPEAVVLPGDDPDEIAMRLSGAPPMDLLLVDESGRPAGVVPAAAWTRILAGSRAAPRTSGRGRFAGTAQGDQ